MKRPFEALLSAWIASVLGHLLRLCRVRGIQARGGRRRSGPGRDHPTGVHPWRAAGARMRQELGAVRGCSTHLGGKGKYDSGSKNKSTLQMVQRVQTVCQRRKRSAELVFEGYI